MITNYPPFTIIHPRGSYLNHRINHAGTGLLCGKPLPARLDVPDIDNGKPDCRACSRRWSAIQDAADNRLRRAGCRCYYPARVWIHAANTVQCAQCGIAVPLDGVEEAVVR